MTERAIMLNTFEDFICSIVCFRRRDSGSTEIDSIISSEHPSNGDSDNPSILTSKGKSSLDISGYPEETQHISRSYRSSTVLQIQAEILLVVEK